MDGGFRTAAVTCVYADCFAEELLPLESKQRKSSGVCECEWEGGGGGLWEGEGGKRVR